MTRDELRSRFNPDIAKYILLEVKSVLDKNNIEFFLSSGTLLGAVRGNKILNHDFDIDIGAKQEVLVPKLNDIEKQFRDLGYATKQLSTPYQYNRYIKISKNGLVLDIIDYKLRDNERVHIISFNRGSFVYPKEMFDNLGEIDFLGTKFKTPNPVEKYLELSYTVSWTVEDARWNWENCPCLDWRYADFMRGYFSVINPLHISSKRDYKARMDNDKVHSMKVARQFGADFWDGDRKYGYGGYKDDGRWKSVAEKFQKIYGLNQNSRILDIGCGKGYLGKCFQDMFGCNVWGCDISDYALDNCVLQNKFKFRAGKDELTEDYDLIISTNTLHNLILPELKQAIQQINLHSKQAHICVESYRNEQELYNLQCWALTCEQFLRPEEWEFLFNEWGYIGDYEFIFFE